ncbi:MAG: CapA family protein [Pseudolysinimonas sp.]|uniref:CapA family protein n=1 Tax=Pseudolysinimonas sp. TaxID=2680009 RepID=UPI0032632267
MNPIEATSSTTVRILAVGDLVLDQPDIARWFEPTRDLIRSAHLAIGQIEVPHSTSTEVATLDVPAPPADPANLVAAAEVGFAVGTLAGNHVYDCGPQGISDTIATATGAGMTVTGAGAHLAAARKPAIVERLGRSIGVVSYNCVGPRESWATSAKAGAAYVRVITHYELDTANPGGPPSVYTFADRTSLASFVADVKDLAATVQIPIVALHKGIGHVPVDVADYEIEVAHAAIDAGAHAVIGHHAHILRGIEMYRGRPIFHGLGNFVTVTNALATSQADSPERQAWARRRRRLFGFEPDPAMPVYPFHPESRNTMIAVLDADDDGLRAGFIPCWIDDDARPVPHGDDDRGISVTAYIARISREAGFDTTFTWQDGIVRVGERST